MKSQKGFTLIELLVVIAIIGILSSVVLPSLNSARAKAGDAAVKNNLTNIRNMAALYYDEMGRYGSGMGDFYAGDCLTIYTMFKKLL
ncbi:MAG: type II secretion system protein [Candidatus Pacebacteria bacterium]|nr:type II secretion system protein [Candidatus Paceibacterota bacterium]